MHMRYSQPSILGPRFRGVDGEGAARASSLRKQGSRTP